MIRTVGSMEHDQRVTPRHFAGTLHSSFLPSLRDRLQEDRADVGHPRPQYTADHAAAVVQIEQFECFAPPGKHLPVQQDAPTAWVPEILLRHGGKEPPADRCKPVPAQFRKQNLVGVVDHGQRSIS